jgi:hypothetical protein
MSSVIGGTANLPLHHSADAERSPSPLRGRTLDGLNDLFIPPRQGKGAT